MKTICENLDVKAKEKLHKGNQKKSRHFLKIWMMKP